MSLARAVSWHRDYKHVELSGEVNPRYIPTPKVRLYVSVGNERWRHELNLYIGFGNDRTDDVAGLDLTWITPPGWLVRALWHVVPRRWRG